MKKIILSLSLACALCCSAALAAVPLIVIKSKDELKNLPKTLSLGVIEIMERAPVSGLDAEKGIVPLLLLTPESAAARWGAPKETYNEPGPNGGKGYQWANGYTLNYTRAGKLYRVLYWVPADVVLPFSTDIVAQWGFVAYTKPDAHGPRYIRWGGGTGPIKGISLGSRTVAGQKQLSTVQILLNR